MSGLHRSQRTVAALSSILIVVGLAAGGCGGAEFSEESAFEYLTRQCEFGPRAPGSPGHDAALAWLIDTLSETADQVAVQRFRSESPAGGVDLTNVIASFRLEERERVLLAAHWDTRMIAERDPDPARQGEPILGANDGASGVAVLLSLAELMAERAPSVGVDLVFFDGEDGGSGGGLGDWCLGSSYYAAHLGSYAPRYAVVIDMIGDSDLGIPMEANSVAAHPLLVREIWEAAARVGSASFLDHQGPAMYDDHVPLIRAGIPTVLVIDPHYESWHTTEDTPDKCSPESLAEVGRVLVDLLY